MKQTKTALMMLMVCFIAFSSCKKDSSTKASASLTVKIDGVSKTATHVLATYYKSENTLQLMATFSGTENVSLMIQNVKAGSFDVASNDVIATYGTSSSYADTYTGSTGTVVVSSFGNGSISGTFNFVANNYTNNGTKNITAGTFSTTYISQ